MTQSAMEEANRLVEETRAKAEQQAITDAAAEQEILDKATATVKTLRSIWANAKGDLLKQMGNTPEAMKAIEDAFNNLEYHHINATYNAVQFVDMYLYHMNGQGQWDMGARYVIDDFVRGFLNHAPAIPLEYLNREDPSIKQNPLYKSEPLPVNRLLEDAENTRIPVRIETFEGFYTGYLEMFRFVKEVNGNPITIITTAPAIRTRDAYITLNSVYRWYEIAEKLLLDDWNNGKWRYIKKSANSIVPATSQPTPEIQNE